MLDFLRGLCRKTNVSAFAEGVKGAPDGLLADGAPTGSEFRGSHQVVSRS